MKRLLLLTTLLGFGVGAETLKQEWDPTPGVESYEYEISESPKFKADELVRQGTTRNPRFEDDFRPGIYYFRVRVIEAEGRPGKWSSPIRTVLKGEPAQIKVPKKGEKIEVIGTSTPVFFQWSSVEGATDYELQLQPKNGKVQTYVVPSPALSLGDLATGNWEARIVARVNGEPFSKSEAVPFSLSLRSLPKPRFLEPQDGDLITAYEMSRIRWTRNLPGKKSEVIVARVDDTRTKVVSRDPISGATETRTPALPPGRYQITIRDFADESTESADSTVTVLVEADPMGYHSQYLGATFRFMSGEIVWGSNEMSNPSLNGGEPVKTRPRLSKSKLLGGGLEMRFQTRVSQPWGAEISVGLDVRRFMIPNPDDATKEQGESITPYRVKLGPTYKWEPWGPTKPIFLKGLLFARDFRQITLYKVPPLASNPTGDRGYATQMHYAQIWGLSAGAELRYGGWNPRWDAISELNLDFPLMSFGSSLGSGAPTPLPLINFMAALRTKLTDEVRLFGGGTAKWEHLSSSNGSRAEGSSHMNTSAFGIKGGIEIDL